MDSEITAQLQRELSLIKERNARVEAEKAWEGSFTRIAAIMTITYVVASVAMYAIGNDHPLRNALIPVLGFLLSTQSIPFLKARWMRASRRGLAAAEVDDASRM
jgi:hypothetical protein